jgi:hypothetical protein
MLVDIHTVAHGIVVSSVFLSRLPITALVRTVQRVSVGVRGYLTPHNFVVISLRFNCWGSSLKLPICF